MINLMNLSMENFFSHRNTNIDFTKKTGLVMIEGINDSGMYTSNGSGKSTILEGIVYSLSGNTLRNVGVNEVVNRTEGKDTRVSLQFSKSGSTYRINRYRKHKEKGNALELWEETSEPQNIGKRLNQDSQVLLDTIVDIPYSMLVNTIILGEGLSSKFTQLADSDKKSLIESTLNLPYDLDRSRDNVSAKIKELKLSESNLRGKLTILEESVSEDVENIKESVNELLESQEKSRLLLIHYQESYKNMKESRYQLEGKVNLLKDSLVQYDGIQKELGNLDDSTVLLYNELRRVQEEESPVCSHCNQFLDSEESRQAVIEKLTTEIKKNSLQMKELTEKLSLLPTRDVLSSKYSEFLETMKSQDLDLERLQSAIRDTSLTINSAESSIKYKRVLIENYETSLLQRGAIQQELSEVQGSLERYEYLYRLFSPTGIITYILEESLVYINERLKIYSNILLDKSYKLKLQKGKISLFDEKGSSYQSLSNGEKRRLDLCIQFSLHDYTYVYCGSGMNVLFLDEVLDTLDSVGVENIIEVLNLKRNYCNLDCIFVISHNDSLKSLFDDRITVRKNLVGDSFID